MPEYDLAILGGGPGGYQAAFHARSRGLSTALIEKSELGGVCLNWGCIPTKTLLSATKFYDRVKRAGAIGVELPSYNYSWTTMLKRKDSVVSELRKGLVGQLQRSGVNVVRGKGRLTDERTISVASQQGEQKIL